MHLCDEMLYDQIRLINSELLKHQRFSRYGNNESVRMLLNAHFTRWAKVYSCVNYSKDIDAQNRLRRMIE